MQGGPYLSDKDNELKREYLSSLGEENLRGKSLQL
jgi:hypothetical protein